MIVLMFKKSVRVTIFMAKMMILMMNIVLMLTVFRESIGGDGNGGE